MEMTTVRNSPIKARSIFERYAWIPLLVVILLMGLNGLTDLVAGGSEFQTGETIFMHSVTGISWNELRSQSPGVANLVDVLLRMAGVAEIMIALLNIMICLTGFRRGERWAWFALWLIPLWFLVINLFILSVAKLPHSGSPVPVISGSILASICVAALGLSYRKFFRSQQRSNNGGA